MPLSGRMPRVEAVLHPVVGCRTGWETGCETGRGTSMTYGVPLIGKLSQPIFGERPHVMLLFVCRVCIIDVFLYPASALFQ